MTGLWRSFFPFSRMLFSGSLPLLDTFCRFFHQLKDMAWRTFYIQTGGKSMTNSFDSSPDGSSPSGNAKTAQEKKARIRVESTMYVLEEGQPLPVPVAALVLKKIYPDFRSCPLKEIRRDLVPVSEPIRKRAWRPSNKPAVNRKRSGRIMLSCRFTGTPGLMRAL